MIRTSDTSIVVGGAGGGDGVGGGVGVGGFISLG